jgi:hypothetical protein
VLDHGGKRPWEIPQIHCELGKDPDSIENKSSMTPLSGARDSIEQRCFAGWIVFDRRRNPQNNPISDSKRSAIDELFVLRSYQLQELSYPVIAPLCLDRDSRSAKKSDGT